MPPRADESPTGRHADGPRPALSAHAEALERVRASVHRWIDRIEALAAVPTGAVPEPEEALAHHVRELEQRRAELQDEIRRRDREWSERLEALEDDRRLLGEAWERLEREQVAAARAAARPSPSPPEVARPAATAPTPTPASREDEAVDRMIIRQFEELRRDVRRAADSRPARSP